MSYTVFALTWRPKSFDEITGQQHIVTQLKNAIQKDRLAHAYLFAGPRGVGKTSTARILAKSLNCKEGPTDKPCGKCPACLDIANSRSLDVIEIDGASNRGIDEIRTLRENVKFSPANGKFKVYIIDEVHQITTDGFNALLKTLEEPPEFVKFIFATTQPNKVPATILSRCQRLDFRRISVMEIIAQLEKIVEHEKVAVDKDVLTAIARASDGSLRDAESILDQLVAFAKESVSLEDVVSMLGMVEQNTLFEITDSIIRKDTKTALQLLDAIIEQGKDTGTFLNDLLEHFRNLMIAKVCRDNAKLIDLPQEVCIRLVQQANGLSMEEIFNAFSLLLNAQEMTKRIDSMRIPLEICLVRLCRTQNQAASQRPAAGPASVQAKAPAVPPVPPAPVKAKTPEAEQKKIEPVDEPAGPAVKNQVPLEAIQAAWHTIVQEVSKVKISIGSYLKEAIPVKVHNNMVHVAFHKNHSLYKESLEKKENCMLLEKAMGNCLNTPMRVHFSLLQEEKHHEQGADHPAVRSALDTFNARLIKEG